MITINGDRYQELIETEVRYKMLVDALFGDSRLSYSNTYLRFEDESVQKLMKLIEPKRYAEKLAAMQEMEADE